MQKEATTVSDESNDVYLDGLFEVLDVKSFMKEVEVSGGDAHRTKHVYPTDDLPCRDNFQLALENVYALASFDKTGRQGLFCYSNKDDFVFMGMKAARLSNREDQSNTGTNAEFFG
jgi:hypothetical protein